MVLAESKIKSPARRRGVAKTQILSPWEKGALERCTVQTSLASKPL